MIPTSTSGKHDNYNEFSCDIQGMLELPFHAVAGPKSIQNMCCVEFIKVKHLNPSSFGNLWMPIVIYTF